VVILESAAATVLVAGTVFILRACWRIDQPKMALARSRRSPRKTSRGSRSRPQQPTFGTRAA